VEIFSEVCYSPEFKNDMKKLLKKFTTLEEDLKTFVEKQLNLYHKLGIDNKGIFQITGLQIKNPKIYKVKKFACRSLKGKGVNSGIRVIYAYFESEDRIDLIEIYYKGNKGNEDKERILKHYEDK